MRIEFECSNCGNVYDVPESSPKMDMQWVEFGDVWGYDYVTRCPKYQKANIISVKES